MFSMRGDAHKIYLKLKDTKDNGESVRDLKDLIEVQSIQNFYQSMDSQTLKLIYFRMIKEKNGEGIIPIFVTAIPWLLFLFSEPLMEALFKEGSILWAVFGFVYLLVLMVSVILHFREKAWAAFHIEIIQDIFKKTNRDR